MTWVLGESALGTVAPDTVVLAMGRAHLARPHWQIPGQALTKLGAARDMPGGLHISWNRFQPLRLPMLHSDPAKPVAPVAGAGLIFVSIPSLEHGRGFSIPGGLERGGDAGSLLCQGRGHGDGIGHAVLHPQATNKL